jgi:preprotein translocase subunit SecY
VASTFAPLVAAFKLPDLRRRILYVFGMFALYVVGLHIPIAGIDPAKMQDFLQGGLLNLFDVFSGGAFRKFSILAMGIMPYINASIIFQLLGLAWPRIAELQKEGESGRKKLSQYQRWLTIFLALLQALMSVTWLRKAGILDISSLQVIPTIVTLTGGTCFLMWMGEQMTDKGIGNGVSLIIFAGIVARMPAEFGKTMATWQAGVISWVNVFLLAATWLLTVAGIVCITKGERRITTQSAKRVVGTKVYGGGSSHLPLRVNQAGVIPIIFAIAVAMLPSQIATMTAGALTGPWADRLRYLAEITDPQNNWVASLVYFLLVVGFTFFYTAVQFNVADVADNLKKYGSFIPGIRPGKPTERHLDRVLTRITLAGALFLGVIALLSYYMPNITGVTSFTVVGGTSLLILVGVALDTMQQIEAHLVMRQYEGFIR